MMERILSEIKFTCMGTYMSLQQPRTGETFSTKWTLASLVMSSNVHRIGGHRDVSFLTMRTFPRLLVLQRPVKQSTNQGNVCVWPGKKVHMFKVSWNYSSIGIIIDFPIISDLFMFIDDRLNIVLQETLRKL